MQAALFTVREVGGHNGVTIEDPPQTPGHHITVMHGVFQRVLHWAPIMLIKDVSLSGTIVRLIKLSAPSFTFRLENLTVALQQTIVSRYNCRLIKDPP